MHTVAQLADDLAEDIGKEHSRLIPALIRLLDSCDGRTLRRQHVTQAHESGIPPSPSLIENRFLNPSTHSDSIFMPIPQPSQATENSLIISWHSTGGLGPPVKSLNFFD